jgi:hypothetical protein
MYGEIGAVIFALDCLGATKAALPCTMVGERTVATAMAASQEVIMFFMSGDRSSYK